MHWLWIWHLHPLQALNFLYEISKLAWFENSKERKEALTISHSCPAVSNQWLKLGAFSWDMQLALACGFHFLNTQFSKFCSMLTEILPKVYYKKKHYMVTTHKKTMNSSVQLLIIPQSIYSLTLKHTRIPLSPSISSKDYQKLDTLSPSSKQTKPNHANQTHLQNPRRRLFTSSSTNFKFFQFPQIKHTKNIQTN